MKIHSDDPHTLERLSEEVRTTLSPIPGVTPPVVETIRETEELHIRLRPDDLAQHAFYVDYLNRKAEYIEKFMAHIDWNDVARRFSAAV